MPTFVTLKRTDPPSYITDGAGTDRWAPIVGIPNRPIDSDYNYPYRIVQWYHPDGTWLGSSGIHRIMDLMKVETIPCRDCYEDFPLDGFDQERCHECQRVVEVEAYYEDGDGEND